MAILKSEEKINRLDAICGDGDCGSALAKAAHGLMFFTGLPIVQELSSAISKAVGKLSFANPSVLFTQLSHLFEDEVGGTSGAVGQIA